MFQKHMAQITSAETQTSHKHGFSNGKQQQCFSSQNINFMSPCDSKGKQNSVMLWANTGVTFLIVADEERTKPRQRTLSTSLTEKTQNNRSCWWEWRQRWELLWCHQGELLEQQLKHRKEGTTKFENYHLEKSRWGYSGKFPKDFSRRLVILGEAWPDRQLYTGE